VILKIYFIAIFFIKYILKLKNYKTQNFHFKHQLGLLAQQQQVQQTTAKQQLFNAALHLVRIFYVNIKK
jgi:hypothetical protein